MLLTSLKYMCGATIIGSSSLIGLTKSKELDDNVEIINDLKSILIYIKNEIQYNKTNIDKILENAKTMTQNNTLQKIFHDVLEELYTQESITEPIKHIINNSSIDKKIGKFLIDMFNKIGNLNMLDNSGEFELCMSNLENLEDEFLEYKNKYGKVYKSLGFLGGIGITILLS